MNLDNIPIKICHSLFYILRFFQIIHPARFLRIFKLIRLVAKLSRFLIMSNLNAGK
ncbi:hypothetical protein C1646_691434 [Rhizophagus diaphanus]|nr:hypothetical protein C1646_691434 [Rhizophagus diaphanus] [Rhizophagus sp. MUCL 43196]